MKKQVTAILCSGVTLGAYNPALILHRKFSALGIASELQTCETLFFQDKKLKILEMKKMFHNNFKFALMGQKVSGTVQNNFDPFLLEQLYDRWYRNEVRNFILFSGFWMEIIEVFFKKFPSNDYNVKICHMDAVESASWKLKNYNLEDYDNIWLFNWEQKSINNYISISEDDIVPFDDRDKRLVIHGGGWGLGTYKEKIAFLESQNIKLDIINYEYRDITNYNSSNRYFIINPDWKAWEPNDLGEYSFPPFGRFIPGSEVEYTTHKNYPGVYNLIMNNVGIISKPGGGTIIDSLSSATPIIFLDPYGDYEKKNAELITDLGLGIWFDDWQKSSYSFDLLKQCHENLAIKREGLIDIMDLFKEKNHEIIIQ